MTKRIVELDYLNCLFILLMVASHLVCFGQRYPVANILKVSRFCFGKARIIQ